MLDADGVIDVFDIETGTVVAQYEGIDVHFAMLELPALRAMADERQILINALREYANHDYWSKSASEVMEPPGPDYLSYLAEVELPFQVHYHNYDGDGWEIAEKALKKVGASGQ